jgi:1-acyl-sn-glycerol-3-phosphate acyltransferase
LISKVFWKLSAENAERLCEDNIILASNHQSLADIVWIYAFIPRRCRRNVFMTGKGSLKFLKFIFWGAPIIFIERDGNVVPALKASADVLRSGRSLTIFPEGTRTETGELGHFKSGAAYLAKNLGKKIVPISIRGGCDVLPRNKTIPRFFSGVKASLVIGNPIDPEKYSTVDELTQALREEIQKNLK